MKFSVRVRMYCKNVDAMCDFYGSEMESLHHLFWPCIATRLLWRLYFVSFAYEVYDSRVYKLGIVMWADIKGELQDYEREKVNLALYTRG